MPLVLGKVFTLEPCGGHLQHLY